MATIKISGEKELISKLESLANIDLKEPLTTACLLVENEAKRNCPVDTGALRNSITHEVNDNEGTVGTPLEYAPYVEYGTGIWASEGDGRQDKWSYKDAEGKWHTTIGHKPQPFLVPALTDNRNSIMEAIFQSIKKEIEE